MNFDENLLKYANLIIKEGLKIKKDDILVIRGQVENYKFMRILSDIAFREGAKDVKITYRDQEFSKIRFTYASIETVSDVPQYFIDEQNYFMDKRAKYLSIVGDDPKALSEIDPEKIKASVIANSKALKNISEQMMSNTTSWCVVGAATESWAKVVFKDLPIEEAVNKLWELIFYTCRINEEDPVFAWEEHVSNLKKWSNFLNEKQFEYLKYKNDLGTDLTIKLPKNYIFSGASEFNKNNEEFIANMPTEEVFSLPHRDGANGIVYNTKPLNYNGNLIDGFYLKFKDGVVTEFDAKVGYETLKNLLEADENSNRLGEVALVPFDSPISNTNVLFYNTLYDENASCHLALGKAYPTCLQGAENMSEEELLENGVNDSLVHEDFMIGDKTLNIIGVEYNGNEVQIFKDGNFVI